MQSIDDEIPDLSGPVSLGSYNFTVRGPGKKYETQKLSELRAMQEVEGKNKVTESTTSSSTHSPRNPPPSSQLSSSRFPEEPTRRSQAGRATSVLPSLEKRAFHEPDPPHNDGLGQFHCTTPLTSSIGPIGTDRQGSQASGQVYIPSAPVQGDRSSQESSALVTPSKSSSQIVRPSFPLEDRNSTQHFGATIDLHRQSPQSASRQAGILFPLQDHSLNLNSFASITTIVKGVPQVSEQGYSHFPPSDRLPDTSAQGRKAQKSSSLDVLQYTDGRSLRPFGQASPPFPSQRPASEPSGEIASEINDLLTARTESLQASKEAHCPVPPKDYSSPQTLPLSDTLLTATFNLETGQWDPDLADANMSAHTPTNKSTRGGHSRQLSSRQSSSRISEPSQDFFRNPGPIVTTTKSGRPYTNPYMPIDVPPSAARQSVRGPPTGRFDSDNQNDDPDIVRQQDELRYIDQEEARYRALEQATYGNADEPFDDPFQEERPRPQHFAHNQPSNYAEHASQQSAYSQMPDFGHLPTRATYASDPSASSFLSNPQRDTYGPNAGILPYHGQPSAYEQQPVLSHRAQNIGVAPHGQRSVYEQPLPTNPRASVRLPAVRGTVNQQKLSLQEPSLPAVRGTFNQQKVSLQEPSVQSLSLEDFIDKNTRDQRRLQTQGGVQVASGRVSHAVPIRDPAAYTGSGLTTRRNQEASRQNLDTVLTSSQGSTGSARTVMNDPHRDRQLPTRSSSTVTDTTITGSTLRAQAPSYEAVTTQRPVATNLASMSPRTGTSHRQGRTGRDESEIFSSQPGADKMFSAGTETIDHGGFRAPAVPPGFGNDAATLTRSAGLPAAAAGAGNTFISEMLKEPTPKRNPQQRLEDAAAWFRSDPRDLSYAAAVLPNETMNRMNPEKFPLEDTGHRTVSQLAGESQDDESDDGARRATTPKPIGHGRPAPTPPSNHGPRRTVPDAPFSRLASVTSVDDKEGMARSGRQFLEDDAKAIEAMFGGVFNNLMEAKNGPYDYMSHYAPPPAYAIDHNPRNKHTLFDPQWFATAPPARVGRDPRREQGEYEDPTQRSAGRRGDQTHGEAIGRDSSGRGGSGGHVWGRN